VTEELRKETSPVAAAGGAAEEAMLAIAGRRVVKDLRRAQCMNALARKVLEEDRAKREEAAGSQKLTRLRVRRRPLSAIASGNRQASSQAIAVFLTTSLVPRSKVVVAARWAPGVGGRITTIDEISIGVAADGDRPKLQLLRCCSLAGRLRSTGGRRCCACCRRRHPRHRTCPPALAAPLPHPHQGMAAPLLPRHLPSPRCHPWSQAAS
jgi:hypothetical protein